MNKKTQTAASSVIPDKTVVEARSYDPSPSDKKKLAELVDKKVKTERALAQHEMSYLAQKSQMVNELTKVYEQLNQQSVDALKFGEKDVQKPWVFDEETLTFKIKE